MENILSILDTSYHHPMKHLLSEYEFATHTLTYVNYEWVIHVAHSLIGCAL